jgi:hypothetical protein
MKDCAFAELVGPERQVAVEFVEEGAAAARQEIFAAGILYRMAESDDGRVPSQVVRVRRVRAYCPF